jgi:hypothetical protein
MPQPQPEIPEDQPQILPIHSNGDASSPEPDGPANWLEAHPELQSETDEPQEFEAQSLNQLHTLGTQAQQQGLILGHGYHQGQYEILHRQEVLLLTPDEAEAYLQTLIAAAELAAEPAASDKE